MEEVSGWNASGANNSSDSERASVEPPGIAYNLEKMNVKTGQVTVLAEAFYKGGDWLEEAWFDQNRDFLMLKFYHGEAFVMSMDSLEITKMDLAFPSSWPIFLTSPSPDGESFWFENIDKKQYELYDKFGKAIATQPTEQGYVNYPTFHWSSDSRYVAYEYTFDQDYSHVISDIEMYEVAPQGIHILDENGETVRRIEVEKDSPWRIDLAGFLPGKDTVLLHYYQLDRSEGQEPTKVKSVYKAMNLLDGEQIELEKVVDFTKLNGADMFTFSFPFTESVYGLVNAIVSLEHRQVFVFDRELPTLSGGGKSSTWIFINPHYESNRPESTELYRYVGNGTYPWEQVSVPHRLREIVIYNNQWIIGVDEMHGERETEKVIYYQR